MRDTTCQRWLIAGRVQGVGYRAWMGGQAASFGVEGWVRNLADGRVEAEVRAQAPVLARLLEVGRRGPRHAQVSAIEVVALAAEAAPAGTGFRQRENGD